MGRHMQGPLRLFVSMASLPAVLLERTTSVSPGPSHCAWLLGGTDRLDGAVATLTLH